MGDLFDLQRSSPMSLRWVGRRPRTFGEGTLEGDDVLQSQSQGRIPLGTRLESRETPSDQLTSFDVSGSTTEDSPVNTEAGVTQVLGFTQ